MKNSVYEIITQRIEDLLNQGTIPWRKPWRPEAGAQRNLVSKKSYRGINVFMLNAMGFSSPFWLSFKQAKQVGGKVRKGEKGTPVIFWQWLLKATEDENGEKNKAKTPLLRYYTVFNVEQCEGIPAEKIPALDELGPEFDPIEQAQAIMDNMPQRPAIHYGGNRAYYSPSLDYVKLPPFESFLTAEEYYSTAFHELIHSTGHSSRLDRKEVVNFQPFGSEDYSREELVAEMGAAFLCGMVGIEQATIENSAAYIQSWLKELKNDRKLVVYAAAAAQKASDFILDVKYQEMDGETEQP